MVSQTLLTTATAFAATVAAGKRGLAYNDGIDISGFPNSQVSWTYNWDSTTNANVNYGEYVPLLWSNRADHTNKWNNNANYWLSRGSRHLLAFNEPDRPDQANMSPRQAADAWRQYMEPFAGRAKLGAPAISNGGLDWLKEFLNECQDCSIDFIPVHWYNSYSQEEDLAAFLYKVDIYAIHRNLPIWLTEFKGNGTESQQIDFLKEAMHHLDNIDVVERYAYFGINNNNKDMIQGNGPKLTNLGNYYGYGTP